MIQNVDRTNSKNVLRSACSAQPTRDNTQQQTCWHWHCIVPLALGDCSPQCRHTHTCDRSMIFLANTFDMWPPPLNTSLVIRLPVLLMNGQMPPVFGDGWVCARRSGGAALADLLLLVPKVIPENGAPQLRASKCRGSTPPTSCLSCPLAPLAIPPTHPRSVLPTQTSTRMLQL